LHLFARPIGRLRRLPDLRALALTSKGVFSILRPLLAAPDTAVRGTVEHGTAESHRRLARIVAKNPTSILFARVADEYLVDGETARATETCRRGLRYRPSYATGHLVLGRCHRAAGRLEEARQEFQKVLQLDSDNLAAFLYLGRTELAMGNGPQGLAYLSRALQLDPFNDALVEEVAALDGSLDIAAAEARSPAEAPSLDEVAPADSVPAPEPELSLPAEPRSARRAPPRRSVTPDQQQPFVSLTLADLYADQGHGDLAIAILRRVLSLDPENKAVRARLARLESGETGIHAPDAGAKES